MGFPALFINHGGGPLPLIGRQPELVNHMKEIVSKHLPPRKPKAIVVISAHYEADPVEVTSAQNPPMLYDYGGFPPETYEYKYSAPGSPELAQKIQSMLNSNGINCKLNETRGFDHGVFIPLMIMYPEATIPVVSVSLHSSLDIEINLKVGSALASLQEEDVLLMGSGYSFHNMQAFFMPPNETIQASIDFNEWLKTTLLDTNTTHDPDGLYQKLKKWKSAPGALLCHPREEHLLPLLMVATATATVSENNVQVIYDSTPRGAQFGQGSLSNHAITGYMFG